VRAIERKEFPSWTVKVQIMPFADAPKYRFNLFDLTKVWSQKDYPLIEVGKLVLNRNPENYFAEIEQAAFDPANFVPGIGTSQDKMLQGRLFAYGDAHRYRLMSEDEKKRLVENISGSLSRVSQEEIIEKSIGHFRSADADFGDRPTRAIKARRQKS